MSRGRAAGLVALLLMLTAPASAAVHCGSCSPMLTAYALADATVTSGRMTEDACDAGAGPAGSWTARAEPVRAAVAGRSYWSRPLAPADGQRASAGRITSVHWQYVLRGGQDAAVALCRGSSCVPVPARGRSEAFAGQPASQPFRFRVTAAGSGAAAELTDVQLIVNFEQGGGEPCRT